MQQSSAAAALYDGPLHNAGPPSDTGDAVMSRWLQSAGLQHLASPVASTGTDQHLLPNLLVQVLFKFLLIHLKFLSCVLLNVRTPSGSFRSLGNVFGLYVISESFKAGRIPFEESLRLYSVN